MYRNNWRVEIWGEQADWLHVVEIRLTFRRYRRVFLGIFDAEGNFYPLPRISTETLEKVFAGKMLAMLVKEKLISQDVVKKILIQERGLIERILKHLGLLDELHIHSPPLPKSQEGTIVYEPFFDDLPEDEQMELAQTMK